MNIKNNKIMPATGVIVGLALAIASFAPIAFAQTSGTGTTGSGATTSGTTGTTGNTGTGTGTSGTGSTNNTGSGTSTGTTNSGSSGSVTGGTDNTGSGSSTTSSGTTGTTGTTGNTGTGTGTGSTGNTSGTGTNTSTSTGTGTGSNTNENSSGSTQASTSPVQIRVMNHLCNTNIRNMDDFRNMQQGKGSVQAFAEAEANCPNSVLPGNQPVSGTVSAPKTVFDYSLMAPNGSVSTLNNATFMNKSVCENEFNTDFNHSGNISSSTCLDASEYVFPAIASSSAGWNVTLTETSAPAGYHFGTVLFTPRELDQNNDASSLVSSSTNSSNGQSTITLNVSGDNDRVVTLHVFNFLNGTTGTTTNNGGNNNGGNTGGNNNNNGGNTGNNNGGNTGTTTNATTTPFMDREITLARLNAIVNILQRVQDIQSRIVDIVASLASTNWMMGR